NYNGENLRIPRSVQLVLRVGWTSNRQGTPTPLTQPSGAEQAAGGADAELERRPAIPLRVGDQLHADPVAEPEQQRRDGLRVAVQLDDALALLLAQRGRELLAPAAVQLRQLGADLVAAARRTQHLVEDRLNVLLVADERLQ